MFWFALGLVLVLDPVGWVGWVGLVCSGENKQRLGFMLWDFWIGRAMRRALCVFAGLIY
jgi:hypothetical protein